MNTDSWSPEYWLYLTDRKRTLSVSKLNKGVLLVVLICCFSVFYNDGICFDAIACKQEVSMKHHKQLERRTFTQDRFDILIKRQKSGKATFNELTELDDIVNRDPAIRESILEEMQAVNDPPDPQKPDDTLSTPPIKKLTLLDKIISFISRLFMATEVTDLNRAILS